MDSVATHIVLTLRQRIISHGCGYCSGEDNEAFVRVFNVNVPVPVFINVPDPAMAGNVAIFESSTSSV